MGVSLNEQLHLALSFQPGISLPTLLTGFVDGAYGGSWRCKNPKGPWSCSSFCQSSGPSMTATEQSSQETGQSWSASSALRWSSYCFLPLPDASCASNVSCRPSSLHQSPVDASSPPLSVAVRRGGKRSSWTRWARLPRLAPCLFRPVRV
ncbi:hypothetical protein NW755_14972 [Fusarium falciforme]|uniref:Uncharacterized protein n=1 Tax=Fusarium falciforme TaxID=195108 RepID=A0A9W8RFC8_9HYPO|nr:hypothetical protein NW755_14972 [Fusarium falciforme]